MADFRRARWGVRRTFQTEQAIANLSVFDNVLLVHEHTGGSRSTRREDVMDAVEFVGLERRGPPARSARSAPASGGSSRSPGPSSATPRLVLLDEPAAGLPDEETERLGRADPAHPRRRPARS